tara:strand:- start:58 stop:270 length:213 start_codon:yes stop_codon:yes gene_type:complete
MSKKNRRRNNTESEFSEEDFFTEMPKQRDKDRRRNRRQAKNKFDNAIAAARNGYYDELEDVEYDEEYIDY